jgi:hypothetical protein
MVSWDICGYLHKKVKTKQTGRLRAQLEISTSRLALQIKPFELMWVLITEVRLYTFQERRQFSALTL